MTNPSKVHARPEGGREAINVLAPAHREDTRLRARKYLLPSAFLFVLIPVLAIAILLGMVPSISLLTILLGSATAGFVLWRTGENVDLLHPVRVFGTVWCFCLALASLRLTTNISDWGLTMWSYVLGALCCFVGGFWLATRVLTRLPGGRPSRPWGGLASSELLAPRRTVIVAVVCLAVGVGALAYEYREIGVIPIFAQNIDVARTEFVATVGKRSTEVVGVSDKVIVVLTWFCRYAVYLACAALFQKARKSKAQMVMLLAVVAVGFLAIASQGSRGTVFEVLIVGVALFHYLRRRLRLKEVAMFGVALILFISIAGYWRTAVGSPAVAYRRAKLISNLPRGEMWDWLAYGNYTLTVPLEVFYRLTQDLPALPRSSGGYLFYPLRRVVARENIQQLAARLYTADMITPTFLGEFYADFGLWGILLGPMILGFGYGYVYFRALRQESSYWLFVNALFLVLLIYFPHVNFFSYTVTWVLDLLQMAWLIRLVKAGTEKRGFSSLGLHDTTSPVVALGRLRFRG